MPRNVRNAWIDVNVDGRAESLSGGPKNSGGQLRGSLYQRNEGAVGDPIKFAVWPGNDKVYTEFQFPPGAEWDEQTRTVRYVTKR